MLWSAFIFGLLGSLHCVGMCGPIALMLPVDRQNETRKFFQIFLYHLGRISTYALIGLFFGLIGESFTMFGFQQQLSIIIGVLMLLSVILPQSTLNSIKITQPLYKFIGKIKSEIGQSLKKKEMDTFFYLGFLNGFLPCGLVYMAVFASVAVSGLFNSAAYMMIFGLGTIPLMTLVIYAKDFIQSIIKFNVRKIIPVAVGVIGILFILRGMGLGIPYVSPKPATEQVDASKSCHF